MQFYISLLTNRSNSPFSQEKLPTTATFAVGPSPSSSRSTSICCTTRTRSRTPAESAGEPSKSSQLCKITRESTAERDLSHVKRAERASGKEFLILYTGKNCFLDSFLGFIQTVTFRRIHTGVMPYSCSTCGKSFRYKVTQRTHKCQQQQQQENPAQPQQPPTLYPALPLSIQNDLKKLRTMAKTRTAPSSTTVSSESQPQNGETTKPISPVGQMEQLRISESLLQAQKKEGNREQTNSILENLFY